MIKIKHITVSLLLTFLFFTGYTQEFKVYNFEEFKEFLYQKDDNTYVINFWATWCRPCVSEIPAFNKLNEKYQSSDVKILMVSLDFGKNVQSRIEAFRDKHNMTAEIIILDDPDSNSWINKVNKDWSGAIPATIIYNKNKRAFFERSFSYEDLEKELIKFL